MNITDYSMNVSCEETRETLHFFMNAESHVASEWTRRDLNPRPPALLESLGAQLAKRVLYRTELRAHMIIKRKYL